MTDNVALVMTGTWVDLTTDHDLLGDAPSDSGFIDPAWSMTEFSDLDDVAAILVARAEIVGAVSDMIGAHESDDGETFYGQDSVEHDGMSWTYDVHVVKTAYCDCGAESREDLVSLGGDTVSECGAVAYPGDCPECR